MSISFEEENREWVALCADGSVVILGDHGDLEAAEFTARDLGLDVIWLMDADTEGNISETYYVGADK